MRVMEKLRDVYAAADYATGFLDAALRKAALDVNANVSAATAAMVKRAPIEFSAQTPPPENVPYMTASESLFNEKMPAPARRTMVPPHTISAADLDLSVSGGNTPPHTDIVVTPSASSGCDVAHMEVDPMEVDVDFMQTHDEFDWNAVAGADFDVDQWLQFPAEGTVNAGTGEDFVNGVFGGVEETGIPTQPLLV